MFQNITQIVKKQVIPLMISSEGKREAKFEGQCHYLAVKEDYPHY